MSAWTSDLSVDEFAVLHAAGFDPVGQVMGTSVHLISYAGTGGCGWYGSGYDGGAYTYTASGARVRRPLVAGTGRTGTSTWVGLGSRVDAMYQARRRAVNRLEQECLAVGGDGVVGVTVTVGRYGPDPRASEFSVLGTAVRSLGRRHLRRPFLSDLSGQDVATLLHAGWVPCGLVLGIAVGVRHDDTRTRGIARSWRNGELPGYTDLVHETRAQVRAKARDDVVRQGGSGMVLQDMTLEIGEQECSSYGDGYSDHVAQATLVGTALTPFARTAAPAPRTLQVLRLDQRHGTVVGDRLTGRGEA